MARRKRTVYIVIAEGVYRHEIGGVFDDQQDAIDAAKHYASIEHDNHHDHVVLKIETNRRAETSSSVLGCSVTENAEEVFRTNKKIETAPPGPPVEPVDTTPCEARQEGFMMRCDRCRLEWDVQQTPKKCHKELRR